MICRVGLSDYSYEQNILNACRNRSGTFPSFQSAYQFLIQTEEKSMVIGFKLTQPTPHAMLNVPRS